MELAVVIATSANSRLVNVIWMLSKTFWKKKTIDLPKTRINFKRQWQEHSFIFDDSVFLELSFFMKKFAVTSGPASSLIIVHKKVSIVTLSGGFFFCLCFCSWRKKFTKGVKALCVIMQSLSAVWKLFFTNYFSRNDTIFICITAGLQDYYAYRQGKFSVKSPEKSNYIIGQLSNKRRQLKYNFKKPET